MKKVTQQDIARKLGLSITAVSRALKDSADISEKTKEKVRQTAQKLGYHHLPTQAGAKKTILLFLPFDRPYKPLGETSTYFFISAFLNIFKNLDYIIITLPNKNAHDVEYIQQMMDIHNPIAIVITDTIAQDPRVLYCLEKNITFISHGQTDIYSPHFCCDFNEYSWVFEITNTYLSQGLSDILLILPHLDLICVEHRKNAFCDAFLRHNISFDENNHIFIWDDSTDIEELRDFLKKRNQLPKAAILDSEYMLMQYTNLMKKDYKNHPLPRFASATNVIDLAKIIDIPCDYYWQDFWKIGKKIAKTVLYALENPKEEWQDFKHIIPLIPYRKDS